MCVCSVTFQDSLITFGSVALKQGEIVPISDSVSESVARQESDTAEGGWTSPTGLSKPPTGLRRTTQPG